MLSVKVVKRMNCTLTGGESLGCLPAERTGWRQEGGGFRYTAGGQRCRHPPCVDSFGFWALFVESSK